MYQTQLLNIGTLIEGTVIKRPSQHIKTPYVADVSLNGESVLAHSLSLGCCGMADKGATVLLSKLPDKNDGKLHCQYAINVAKVSDGLSSHFVGINPKHAEQIVARALVANCIQSLSNVLRYTTETVIKISDKVDSRFDFTGVDSNGTPFIMEVKNVPLASNGVAYFPDGYRKKVTDTVSPRALKHVKELTYIRTDSVQKGHPIRCIMCYVIQRSDVTAFMVSPKDPEYRRAVAEAHANGVEIITIVANWDINGTAWFVRDDLPIIL